MYRVWDLIDKTWVTNDIIVTGYEEFAKVFKKIIGCNNGLLKMDKDRYVFHNSIGCVDENEIMIFEGDILKAPNGIKGLVIYSEDKASYLLLNYDIKMCYELGENTCKHLEIIGNIFDTPDILGVDLGELNNEDKDGN